MEQLMRKKFHFLGGLLKKILISKKNIAVIQEQFGSFYLDMNEFANSYYPAFSIKC